MFLLLAATITLSSVISTTLSVHLLTVLQAKGLTLAAAVGLGALVGPSQVAGPGGRDGDRALPSPDLDEGRRRPRSSPLDWRRCGSECQSSHLP